MNSFNNHEWQQHLLRIQALRNNNFPQLEQPKEMRNQLAGAADPNLHSKLASQVGDVVGTGVAWVIWAVIISLILLAIAPVALGGLAIAIAIVPGPIMIGAIAFWVICWGANSLVRSGVRDELERQERNKRREELKKIQL